MPPRLPAILAAFAVLGAVAARAETTASATAATDYGFRGISLSGGKPVVQGAVGYDAPGGWYLGGFASNVELGAGAEHGGQLLGYAGYARRFGDRASVDAGMSYSAFSGGLGYDYAELHVGFAVDDLSGRLYYAPDYFGRGARTVYAELDAARAVGGPVRVLGHVGTLRVLSFDGYDPAGRRTSADAYLAGAVDLDRFRIQLARTFTAGVSGVYPIGPAAGRRNQRHWILSIQLSL